MPSPGWKVTAAVTCRLSGACPALASALENAIEKQAEWAAPSSSSGLVVPATPSERAFQFTGNSAASDESRDVVPDPLVRSPNQSVVASLVSAIVAPSVVGPHYGSRRGRGTLRRMMPGAHEQQVDLAAEAAGEHRVEERGDEGSGRRDHERVGNADQVEHQADQR